MNDYKTANTNNTSNEVSPAAELDEALLNLNVYKELDENPNQKLDLLTHIKSQLQQLELSHKRKMFMIKEISSLRR